MSTDTPSNIELGSLPEALQRGLQAIRERLLPTARVVAVRDNFAYIDIGTMDGEEISKLYTQEAVSLFPRVPVTFPNAEPYGIVTDPLLTRRDGAPIQAQHANHPTAGPIVELLGRDNLGFWSWNCSGMRFRQPEDLVAIVEWARKRIRQG
jgi:hypothetical protein